jgi:hypothetical protein
LIAVAVKLAFCFKIRFSIRKYDRGPSVCHATAEDVEEKAMRKLDAIKQEKIDLSARPLTQHARKRKK